MWEEILSPWSPGVLLFLGPSACTASLASCVSGSLWSQAGAKTFTSAAVAANISSLSFKKTAVDIYSAFLDIYKIYTPHLGMYLEEDDL